MAKDGTWGNHVVLVAAANTYGTSIRVISSVTDHEDILVTPSYTSSQDTETLVLGHVFEYHYVSLEQKSMSGTTHTVQPSAICLSVSWNIQWPRKKFSIVTHTRFSFSPILAYRLKSIFVVHNYCHICPFFLLNFFLHLWRIPFKSKWGPRLPSVYCRIEAASQSVGGGGVRTRCETSLWFSSLLSLILVMQYNFGESMWMILCYRKVLYHFSVEFPSTVRIDQHGWKNGL